MGDELTLEEMLNEGWFDFLFRRKKGMTKHLNSLKELYSELDNLKEDYPSRVRGLKMSIQNLIYKVQDLDNAVSSGKKEGSFIGGE